MAYNHVLCPCKMFKGHFGSCRDIFGHEGIFWVMKFLHCRAILCHEWQFLVIKGHYVAVLGHIGTLKDLCKGPRVVQHDKISCNIPMGIHSKSVKVCGVHFSVSKNLRKKCVNSDVKISRQNHKNLVSMWYLH